MIEYRILGPLEVSADGRAVDIGGPRLRALLAIMLVRANEFVPRDVLVRELWGDRPPADCQGSLDVYVSRLRKALDAASAGPAVITRRGAYRLQVDHGQLDASRFESLVRQGRNALASDAPGQATACLREGLQLWRGEALAGFGHEPFAQAEAGRLEELRLGAIEDRIESDLSLGRHGDVVSELATLVLAHPLRERLHGHLMIALYRCGRQAEALQAYQRARRTLVEDLGLEPGPPLRRLEHAILRQDSSLELPAPRAALPGDEAPARQAAGVLRRRLRASAAALAAAAMLVAGVRLGFGAPGTGQAVLAGANGLVAVSPGSGRVVTAAPLSGAPEAVSTVGSSVWVADPGGGAVTRIDPKSGAVEDRILLDGEPASIVGGDGAIWAASSVGATVVRIDPSTEGVTQTITLPDSGLSGIGFGMGRLWVADSVGRELFEIDPARGSVQRTLPLHLQPSAVLAADGSVWVAGYNDATVEKLAPETGRVLARIHVGNGPVALAFDAGSLWVANSLDSTVSRIDPASLRVLAIAVGSGPSALADGPGSVWVANQYSGTVSRIDPRRNRVTDSIVVRGDPTSLAMGSGLLWVGITPAGVSHRGGTLVVATTATFTSTNPRALTSVDPAFFNQASNSQFTGLAYDSLVTFQLSSGADGLQLVPDLALAIPAPAGDGLSYTFRLRPGIRYSDGQPLRASDFRRGIERLFRLRSPGTTYFTSVLGAAACARYPPRCDLSRGIRTDNATGTVVFHLTAPDPQFLFNLTQDAFAAPVPPGTPDRESGNHFVPGTGPYRIVSASPTRVRFDRNPYFREWSHAAQPAGNPDAVVWESEPTVQDAVAAVVHGRADWMFGLIPRAQYRQIELHSPAQLHSSPEFAVEFAPLNTHRAPFNDVRVRQALNYAIDRRAIAALYGGPDFATITCQVITPGLPGYRRYCPYTRHPRPDGAYTGPDLARARRLVRESGTAGERVDVWGTTGDPYVPPEVPAYFAGVLRSLGYRVRLHVVPFASITEAMRERFQLSVDGDWVANYPDPSAYLPQFFGCGGGTSNGYYCNPALDREMRQASLLETTDPARAPAVWELVDAQITDAAIWVPTVTEREVDLVSRRLRNYEFNPVWGFIVDQSWLRPRGAPASASQDQASPASSSHR
jgi:YVTN family beta-propeller protein